MKLAIGFDHFLCMFSHQSANVLDQKWVDEMKLSQSDEFMGVTVLVMWSVIYLNFLPKMTYNGHIFTENV